MQKKIVRFLLYHNWIWTILLAVVAYKLARWIRVDWISALIGTAGSMAGLLMIARLCMWFFFRKLHEYFYGAKVKPPFLREGQPAPPPPTNPRSYYNHSFNDFVKVEPRSFKLAYATAWFMLTLIMAFVIFLNLL